MEVVEINKKQNWVVIFSIIISAFVLITICSQNSFLYSFNDWVNTNWYITVGEGMLNGKIMYKDLYEQKGPILFFLFAGICFLFRNPFIGTYIVEIICLVIFMYFIYKILAKHTNFTWSIIGVIAFAVIFVTSQSFRKGGGASEEFCMPMIAYMVLCFVEYVFENKPFDIKRSIAIGVCVSLVFWVKFTLIFTFAIAMIIWLILNLKNKKFKNTFISIAFIVVGFVLVSLPVFIYFIANNSMTYLWQTYFYDNLFRYRTSVDIFKVISGFFGLCFVIIIFIILGMIYLIKKYKKQAIPYICLVGINIILILITNPISAYYFIPIFVFGIYGIIFFIELINKIKCISTTKNNILILINCIILLIYTVAFNNNTKDMLRDKNEYPQYQVAEYVKSSGIENPTLLQYKMTDRGFFNILGISPTNRYFALNNFTKEELPEMYEDFENALINAIADFVVVTEETYNEADDYALLIMNYDLVGRYEYKYHESVYNSINEVYYLFQKR